MKAYFIKETYEQIGDYEYNRVNPYVQAIGMLRGKHKSLKVKHTRTFTEPVGSLSVPMLEVTYEVDA